jgi:hypothetical protein
MMNFKGTFEKPEYDFLREHESLGENIILLALGGSHAYGTNNENSDIDVRGCALERPIDLIGFSEFEQVVDTKTDTVIYSFSKLVKLLINMNPNTIEILGCKPEHYLHISRQGKDLIDNQKMFLSQKCANSFGGYAYQQLNRLRNALARDRMPQAEKEEHILNSIKSAMLTFSNRYKDFNDNSIALKVDKSKKEDLEKELFISIKMNKYPLRDFSAILSEIQNILKLYGKLNHRNKKKDESSLDKHAMHLIRLYLMAIDLLEKEKVITYRKDDLKLLRNIRSGSFRKKDGNYHSSFFEMVDKYKKKMDYAIRNTSLPKEPDFEKIEEFVMETKKEIIRRN